MDSTERLPVQYGPYSSQAPLIEVVTTNGHGAPYLQY